MSGIQKAVDKCGGVANLAEKLGVSRQTVYNWLDAGEVAHGNVFAVYDATAVPLHELNPTAYPKDRVKVLR